MKLFRKKKKIDKINSDFSKKFNFFLKVNLKDKFSNFSIYYLFLYRNKDYIFLFDFHYSLFIDSLIISKFTLDRLSAVLIQELFMITKF